MTSKATNAKISRNHAPNCSCMWCKGNVEGSPLNDLLCSTYDENNTIIAVMPSTYSDEYWEQQRWLSRIGSILVGVVLAIGLACILL